MKRPTGEQEARASAGLMMDEAFVKRHPQLVAYLTDDLWEDGKERELASLTFSVSEGKWQVGLNDKAMQRSMYSAAATLGDALRALEKALADGVEAWRPWKRGRGRKA
jgi:hypothetical protein